MSTNDVLKLNRFQMFAKIRAGLTVERLHTQNLLDCKDDLLYAWDSKDCCLLVINWRAAVLGGLEKVKYQSLMPSSAQYFQVERVLVSEEGSLVALAGPRGATILELPLRWDCHGQFLDGKAKIKCRSVNLDAHFFNNNPHLMLHQLRWHPASPTDSHLLLLLSDNTIRVYGNSTLRHIWRVGPTPQKVDANSSLPSVYSLGETAVDFDIAPAINVNCSNAASPDTTVNKTRLSNAQSHAATHGMFKVEWPIVVLRENGNIYVLMAGIDTEQPRLQGPLTITPETVDNYGLDSCALLVIPSLPPTLVIAESNGRLHHALFLEAEIAEDSFNEVDSSLVIHPSEWSVHVLETVELALELPKSDSVADIYHCPIHLKRDLSNEQRYFAYHNEGLHVIAVNYIGELQRYMESDVISDLAMLPPSHAEYIVSTKIKTGERINAVLGFVVLQMPSNIVLLLGSGQVISLKLVIDSKLLVQPPMRRATAIVAKKRPELVLDPNFVDHINGMLRHSETQPILSAEKSATPTSVECYALLMQAIDLLQKEYLNRHQLVRFEMAKRINKTCLRKEQQHRDIEHLEQETENIRKQAHRLATRFEEISGQQDQLTKSCHELVLLANTRLPCNSNAAKGFAVEIARINKATQIMSHSLLRARETIKTHNSNMLKLKNISKHNKFELPERQENTIKEILTEMNSEIDSQIKEVKHISHVVGI